VKIALLNYILLVTKPKSFEVETLLISYTAIDPLFNTLPTHKNNIIRFHRIV